jgi:hypothetical protein
LAAVTAVARVRRIALHALRPWHQIDKIKELAALLRARRCGFALNHAHQANLGNASPDDVKCLHQPGEPVALNLERSAHGFRLGASSQIKRCRSSLRRLFTRRGVTRTDFAGDYRIIHRSSSRCLCRFTLRRVYSGLAQFARIIGRSFGANNWSWWSFLHRRHCSLRVRGPIGLLGFRRPLQQNSGKFGDGLHDVRPSLRLNQGRFIRWMQRPS